MTDRPNFFWPDKPLTRAQRILSQLHWIEEHAAVRSLLEEWCKWAGVAFDDWPDQHEWFGLVDVAVRRAASDLQLRNPGLTRWTAVDQACVNLGLNFENLRHRWQRNGRPL